MNVMIYKDKETASSAAATIIAAQILQKPNSVLGLATGSSPELTYKNLVRLYQEGVISFADVSTFNLDEYIGLDGEHPQSYNYFMKEKLFNHVDIEEDQFFIPNGVAENPEAECYDYEELIESYGGIDLQLLGLGGNGHIGFNEPSDNFAPMTHVVDLTDETIEANSRFFESKDEVPTTAISMGTGSIMKAKSILLIAFGEAKADAVAAMVNGEISPEVQASILQVHPDVTVLVDEAAASKL